MPDLLEPIVFKNLVWLTLDGRASWEMAAFDPKSPASGRTFEAVGLDDKREGGRDNA